MKNNTNIEEIVNILFDQKWYDDVLNAIDLALHHNTRKLNEDDIVYNIIDYNINKRLEEKALNDLYTTLPKILVFKKNNLIETFNTFKNIIENCDTCSKFNKHSLKIIFEDVDDLEKEFLTWPKVLNKEYNTIKIKLTKSQKDHQYKLSIKKDNFAEEE